MTRDIETEEIIPDLLEVGGRQSSIDKGPLDEVKVPITIITGKVLD